LYQNIDTIIFFLDNALENRLFSRAARISSALKGPDLLSSALWTVVPGGAR
jgi:hypothetical protein